MSPAIYLPSTTTWHDAILDMDIEKFMFMDGECKCWIDTAWRNFRPGARISRDQPVEHDALY